MALTGVFSYARCFEWFRFYDVDRLSRLRYFSSSVMLMNKKKSPSMSAKYYTYVIRCVFPLVSYEFILTLSCKFVVVMWRISHPTWTSPLDSSFSFCALFLLVLCHSLFSSVLRERKRRALLSLKFDWRSELIFITIIIWPCLCDPRETRDWWPCLLSPWRFCHPHRCSRLNYGFLFPRSRLFTIYYRSSLWPIVTFSSM